ncbi:MAG: hypothetical protein HY922_08225 [Elusimicrobia bacterium]|nr:hypothetical protein [Elusimicrobiota bacterium]
MTKRAVILCCLLGLALYGAWRMIPWKPPKQQPAPAMKAVPSDGWLEYEDSILRFEYPHGWNVWVDYRPAHGQQVWTVDPPDIRQNEWGLIHIYAYIDRQEKRPLEQIVAENDWSPRKQITQPKQFNLKGGTCLAYIVEGPLDMFGGPNDGPRYDTETMRAECYRENGTYFDIWSDLSTFLAGQPDARYQKNLGIFEHVLQSLEFKPVSQSSPQPDPATKK